MSNYYIVSLFKNYRDNGQIGKVVKVTMLFAIPLTVFAAISFTGFVVYKKVMPWVNSADNKETNKDASTQKIAIDLAKLQIDVAQLKIKNTSNPIEKNQYRAELYESKAALADLLYKLDTTSQNAIIYRRQRDQAIHEKDSVLLVNESLTEKVAQLEGKNSDLQFRADTAEAANHELRGELATYKEKYVQADLTATMQVVFAKDSDNSGNTAITTKSRKVKNVLVNYKIDRQLKANDRLRIRIYKTNEKGVKTIIGESEFLSTAEDILKFPIDKNSIGKCTISAVLSNSDESLIYARSFIK